MKYFKKRVIYSLATLAIFATLSYGNCNTQLFNISTAPGIKISELIEQLSDECSLNIIIKDESAKKLLKNSLYKLNLKNATLEDILDIVLKENGLSYQLNGDILKISYLITKTFNIDYIIAKRSGEATTDASVDIGAQEGQGGGTQTRDVNKIESKDEFNFWENIKEEIYEILNRPEDQYKAPEPIVNPEAGLVTVTATMHQIKRVENYIKRLKDRLHKSVMIDVSILAVELDNSFTKGIDWSKFELEIANSFIDQAGSEFKTEYNKIGFGETFRDLTTTSSATFAFSSTFNLKGLINFLETNGDVTVLSNPKILTLNNQPALITVGETINYNVPTTITITQTGNLGTQSYTPSSIFVGILLNITPEITDDGYILLRINPSVSELKDPTQLGLQEGQKFREIAPDTKEKKISSVLKVKDGSTIIMGGLITNSKNFTVNGVPILKDIPVLGYMFKSKKKMDRKIELVFIIKPKIVKSNKKAPSLRELGFDSIR